MGMESRAGVRVSVDANTMVGIDMAMNANVRTLRQPQKAEILDVSVIGLGLMAPIYIPKGAKAVITVEPPVFATEQTAKVVGEVRYCQQVKPGKYRLGIRFVEIEKPFLAKITEYVEHNKDKAV